MEIKDSDWDQIKPKAVRPNALRQARQIWSYIDSQIELEGKEVSPGIIFSMRPSDKNRLKSIEKIFNDRGIQVIWHDEPMDELRKRMESNQKKSN